MSLLQSNASTQQHCSFEQRSARLLRTAYDMNPKPFAIVRDHIDQITNWYRYSQNVDEAYPERSLAGISFDECFLAMIEDEPPALAAIGSQFNLLTSILENCWSRICLHMKRWSCSTRLCQKILAKICLQTKERLQRCLHNFGA